MKQPQTLIQERDAALQRAKQAKSGLLRLKIQHAWYGLLVGVRKGELTFNIWPPGLILGSTCFVGLASFIAIDQFTNLRLLAAIVAIVAGAATAGSLWKLFFRTHVVTLQQDRDTLAESIQQRRVDAISSMTDALESHAELRASAKIPAPTETAWDERQQQRRNKSLLESEWRNLPATRFLDFAIDLAEECGFEITAAPGDGHGIQLIVESQDRCLAVATVAKPQRLTAEMVERLAAGALSYPVDGLVILSNSLASDAASAAALRLSVDKIPMVVLDRRTIADVLEGRRSL